MAGNQSRGLIRASITKGWDPTKIPAGGPGRPAQDLAVFDVDQGNACGRPVGTLPGGVPDSWVDGFDQSYGTSPTPPSFATPDASRENAQRHTSGANPYPGMPGSE